MKNCASCHGEAGAGDGPQGAMVRAPDLTRPDWQSVVSDDELLRVIRHGKGRMPAFDLTDGVLRGIVRRIRAHRAGR